MLYVLLLVTDVRQSSAGGRSSCNTAGQDCWTDDSLVSIEFGEIFSSMDESSFKFTELKLVVSVQQSEDDDGEEADDIKETR